MQLRESEKKSQELSTKNSVLGKLLKKKFFSRNTVEVARELLGKILWVSVTDSASTGVAGRIVEVEAYRDGDPASHSFCGRTSRNSVMFGDPGKAYVYTIHRQNLLNFVTEPEGIPGAVLIRAVEPLLGHEQMKRFRSVEKIQNLTNGPGKLCQAMGISLADNGCDLSGPRIRVLDDGYDFRTFLVATPRIGISKAQETPWRFVLSNNQYLSRKV